MQRLPPETLMQIFVHIHPTLTRFDWVRNIVVVCRRWKSILVRTPRFWADLVGDSSWDLYGFTSAGVNAQTWRRFTFAVSHSGSLPLQLYMTCVDDQAVDFLIPHRGRIATLVVTQKWPNMGPALERLITAEFPLLERLSIAYVCIGLDRPAHYDVVPYAHVKSALMPRLSALELPGPHFAGLTSFLSLRHLTLTKCGWQDWCSCSVHFLTLDGFLDALQQCHEIETLAIRGLTSTGVLSTIGRVVHLDRLRDMRIEGTPASVSAFLKLVVFPPTITLYLSVDPGDASFMDLLPPTMKADLLAACGAERVRFRGAPWSSAVEIHGAHEQELRITEDKLTVEGYDRQLLQVVSLFSHAPRVEVQLYGGSADDSTLRQAWTRFDNLRSFEMIGCDARLHLLPFMASPEGRQSLHALEHLSVTWNCEHDRWHYPTRWRAEIAQSGTHVATGGHAPLGQVVSVRYIPQGGSVCEAFCRLLAPVLASEPFKGSVKSLLILTIPPRKSLRDVDADTIATVENILQARLGRLVPMLKVFWY